MHGWGYYCKACKHLTSPEAQLHAQLDALPDEPGDPIGVVCAYPLHLEIVQEEPPF